MDKKNIKKNKDKATEQVTEYLKCKKSFDYFLSRKYIILEEVGMDKPMKPYKPQMDLIDCLLEHKYVLVLKSRQIGISTIIQAYVTWLCSFYDNVVVGIISKDGAEATDFTKIIVGMIEKLPDWLRTGFKKKSEQSFILSNGCKVYTSTVNPSNPSKTLRGKAITFLVVDEGAFVNYIDEAWVGMVPALATSQKHAKANGVPFGTIVLSTPNKTTGTGAWFYKRYQRAISGTDIFKQFTIHWKEVEELANDPDWYRTQCALFDNDMKKIEQELELKFLPTSGSFFGAKVCTIIQNNTQLNEPIRIEKMFNGEAWTFIDPLPGKVYMIGVDTAPEHGEDNSGITVWDYETLDQVWEYQGKLSVTNFIAVIYHACERYNGIIIVESNSYGNQVCESIDNNLKYSQRLYKETRGNIKYLGLATTMKTRPLIIDSLYSYVTEYPDIIKSKRLSIELIGLTTKKNGRVEADAGEHDDLCISAGLCFYVRKYDPPLLLSSGKELKESGFNEVMEMNDDIPVGLLDKNKTASQALRNKDLIDPKNSYINVLDLFKKDNL